MNAELQRPDVKATTAMTATGLDVADDTDPGAPARRASGLGRLGVAALVAGLGGLLAWAALAPLDEGVPTQAMVAIDTKRKAVQHLQGGIVAWAQHCDPDMAMY